MNETILRKLYEEAFGKAPKTVTALPGSGSNRKYFRINGHGGCAVGVVGESEAENRAFISLSRQMVSKGLPVPKVLGEEGLCYIVEDLGDVSLFDSMSPDLLKKTIALLPDLQFKTAEGIDWSVCFPDEEFNGRMVDFDLNYFKYCFLKVYGVQFDELALQDDFDALKANLLGDKSDTFMYRDFQARNVMIYNGNPYFIDFQGGRRGPLYYDVASFIWQSRARYPKELKEDLLETYLDSLERYKKVDRAEFRACLKDFVLFRSLQTLGAYGFRGLIEHKRKFTETIPDAISNLKSLLPLKYPYLGKLIEEIQPPRQEAMTPGEDPLEVEVNSFSYRKGLPKNNHGDGGGYVFDCRAIHNPGRYEEFKNLTGKDRPVIEFLENNGEMADFLKSVFTLADAHIEKFLRRGFSHLQLSFGCTGGQHRSVYAAEALAWHIKSSYPEVKVVLRHLARGTEEVL